MSPIAPDAPRSETVSEAQQVDQAVAQGGAYEVLSKRLGEQGARLRAAAEALNRERLDEFGSSQLEVIGRLRIRTENNCIGRDVVQVGELLLFGYNVFIGLKTTTRIEDVFGLYRLASTTDGFDVEPVNHAGSFLADAQFVRDFTELYAYYKDARLLQLVVRDGKLLAAFQIGERISDVRVFRWALTAQGEATYIDARGERDLTMPTPFDFEWTRATRELMVNGRHPHLNVLDTLFVETTGGDLTIKVENNTETGQGIHAEPVDDKTQSLDDAAFDYARVGSLILLKVLPYRETAWRGFIYNTLTGKVQRNDAILQACVQLPEDHGIIFPGGYYLQNGEHKAFDAGMDGMQFKRAVRSPNGEDVLYVFYEREAGRSALFVYNMIQRHLQNPVFGHGYARLADGRMVIFHAEGDGATRIHPMQVWQTPFVSDEFAATRPPGNSYLGRLGNAELVRGLSNLLNLSREIESPEVSVQRYQLLTQNTRRLFDAHHWIDDAHCGGAATLLREIAATGEAVLDEFEKVEGIRRQSEQAMAEARHDHTALLSRLLPESWSQVQEFVEALNAITRLRGRLLTIRDYRYVDVMAIDAMGAELLGQHERIGAATGEFLAGEKALVPLAERLATFDSQAQEAETAKVLAKALEALQGMATDLDMLSELMATLKVDDAVQRTRVVEAISGLYGRLNQARARAELRRKSLGSAEAVAQFGAQFTLFGQSITSALGLATDPERADEQLSRLMVQLEELESQFGEHEQFLGDILTKREELLDTFESHKQALLDDRQRKAQSVLDAANRILSGLNKRAEKFSTPDELNAFFAGDALILKLRELATRLRELKDSVKADDVEARLKGARDQAIRVLRDRADLFEGGGNVIKLGRHRFSVNTQPLDLTILPRGDHLALHLTGTDFMAPIDNPELGALREYWQVSLESESPTLYRAEYLVGELFAAANAGTDGLDRDALQRLSADPDALAKAVRDFAAPRYREGYERGIHDHDATLILRAFLAQHSAAGTLIHPPAPRALAALFMAVHRQAPDVAEWAGRLTSAKAMQALFGASSSLDVALSEMAGRLIEFVDASGLAFDASAAQAAASYLADELTAPNDGFALSRYARELAEGLAHRMREVDLETPFLRTLVQLAARPGARWQHVVHWLEALCRDPAMAPLAGYIPEAAAWIVTRDTLEFRDSAVPLITTISGLLGEHPRIRDGRLTLAADDLLARLHAHREQFLPGVRHYHAVRQDIATREREVLRLTEFQARPLSSFVRNRLISEIYLPIIGDNLAKQMGTVGENKRSDLMGLLMMISPPGYGKTTLMEYVANRLGLIFMKINGPALGHEVRSLDPEQAPDATSKQELEKLNLALEMGNNVMLYVDDIQHTHPEFLQKFISLCDGTRRIEGVWKGRTRTYDMRGKKFCVVMAGNPYTESGEVFKIPDMLANRADIYNLGDVLGGMEEAFMLSYIENSLTSSPVLAPLATRDLKDLYVFVDKAMGRDVSTNELAHAYSAAEVNEIVATLERIIKVRDVVYRVNQQYITSAAQADKYRTEPPFKLQGSYRNMNKLVEKISAVMNEAELQQLVADHYLGEAQLLTTGAEENLLKLKELRGVLNVDEQARWEQIKRDFLRNKAMGADDADVGGRLVAQLADIAGGLQAIGDGARAEPTTAAPPAPWEDILRLLQRVVEQRAVVATPAEVAPPGTNSMPAPELALLLETVRSSQRAQAEVGSALRQLADAIRASVPANPVEVEPGTGRSRGPHRPTPVEAPLDQALAQMGGEPTS
ncbi:DNA repair protein [Lysobacter daejeonensis GH1-9]|uniref:DNA repair protein n=1 Tax=Lysobacter daejeonensis GH1-9 TaxID=1385517 RepID=A0A0A0EU65_9GAMM|nr:DNA repair ATPase [Lysobacter daejeonensis]KGM54074.1 DNA repair protein [Lysobacter daejeonensis GH1-9]